MQKIVWNRRRKTSQASDLDEYKQSSLIPFTHPVLSSVVLSSRCSGVARRYNRHRPSTFTFSHISLEQKNGALIRVRLGQIRRAKYDEDEHA